MTDTEDEGPACDHCGELPIVHVSGPGAWCSLRCMRDWAEARGYAGGVAERLRRDPASYEVKPEGRFAHGGVIPNPFMQHPFSLPGPDHASLPLARTQFTIGTEIRWNQQTFIVMLDLGRGLVLGCRSRDMLPAGLVVIPTEPTVTEKPETVRDYLETSRK